MTPAIIILVLGWIALRLIHVWDRLARETDESNTTRNR